MSRITKTQDQRRVEFVHAALRLFLDRGYASTSVTDVVRAVGVAQGTFYLYFDSKEAVLDAAAAEIVAPVVSDVDQAVVAPGTPIARIERVVAALFESMRRHLSTIEKLTRPDNDVFHARVSDALIAAMVPRLLKVVEDGKRQGVFVVGLPRETAELLLASLGHVTRAHGRGLDRDKSRGLERAARDVFLAALGASSKGRRGPKRRHGRD